MESVLGPAPIPGCRVVVRKWYTREREVIESIKKDKVIIPIEAAKPMTEAVIPFKPAIFIEAAKPTTEDRSGPRD